jgi:peroxiredoxin
MDLKYRIFYFVGVLSFLWGNTEDNPRGFVVNIGDSAPDLSMKLTTGETLKLSELKGSIVILQFTASWCSVCRLEMPHLEEDIWKKYKEKNVVLIGIDRDEPLETVINFKKQMKITYPLALDPGAEIFSLYAEKNSGVTRNIVIDQSGEIVFLTRLFEENEYKQMLKIIENLVY